MASKGRNDIAAGGSALGASAARAFKAGLPLGLALPLGFAAAGLSALVSGFYDRADHWAGALAFDAALVWLCLVVGALVAPRASLPIVAPHEKRWLISPVDPAACLPLALVLSASIAMQALHVWLSPAPVDPAALLLMKDVFGPVLGANVYGAALLAVWTGGVLVALISANEAFKRLEESATAAQQVPIEADVLNETSPDLDVSQWPIPQSADPAAPSGVDLHARDNTPPPPRSNATSAFMRFRDEPRAKSQPPALPAGEPDVGAQARLAALQMAFDKQAGELRRWQTLYVGLRDRALELYQQNRFIKGKLQSAADARRQATQLSGLQAMSLFAVSLALMVCARLLMLPGAESGARFDSAQVFLGMIILAGLMLAIYVFAAWGGQKAIDELGTAQAKARRGARAQSSLLGWSLGALMSIVCGGVVGVLLFGAVDGAASLWPPALFESIRRFTETAAPFGLALLALMLAAFFLNAHAAQRIAATRGRASPGDIAPLRSRPLFSPRTILVAAAAIVACVGAGFAFNVFMRADAPANDVASARNLVGASAGPLSTSTLAFKPVAFVCAVDPLTALRGGAVFAGGAGERLAIDVSACRLDETIARGALVVVSAAMVDDPSEARLVRALDRGADMVGALTRNGGFRAPARAYVLVRDALERPTALSSATSQIDDDSGQIRVLRSTAGIQPGDALDLASALRLETCRGALRTFTGEIALYEARGGAIAPDRPLARFSCRQAPAAPALPASR